LDQIDFERKRVTKKDGVSIRLQAELGGGKEGTVYSSGSSAVKIYKRDRRADDELEEKIAVMIENPPDVDTRDNHQWFAWPENLIYYQDQFVGYEMPQISMDEFENIRTYIRSELAESPGLSENKLKLAHNLATVVSLVHQKGHAVGDFNYENILVSNDKVTMIDCDAYSIQSDNNELFHGTTMYDETVPPEGRPSDTIQKTQIADNFNLAKWIFRIVTGNRNPYQARGELAATGTLLEMMQKNPFPYWNPKPDLIQPTTGQSQYDQLPPELKLLFESTFLGGKFHPYKRPSPEVWRAILENIYKRQVGNVDSYSREKIRLNENVASGTSPGQPPSFNEFSGLDDIRSVTTNEEVTVAGSVTNVTPLNDFERNGETRFVSNITVENNTSKIILTFWNHQGVVAARSFHPGLTLRATGKVKSAPDFKSSDKEIHVEEYEVAPYYDDRKKINNLQEDSYDAHIRGVIVGAGPLRDGDYVNKELTLVLADGSGCCHVILKNSLAKRLNQVPLGLTLEIIAGHVYYKNRIYIDESNKLGNLIPPVLTDIKVAGGDIVSSLQTDSVDSAKNGDRIDLRGTITGIEKGKRNDNIEHVHVECNTGEITIQLQDEFAEYELKEEDRLLATSIKIKNDGLGRYEGFTTSNSVITILS